MANISNFPSPISLPIYTGNFILPADTCTSGFHFRYIIRSFYRVLTYLWSIHKKVLTPDIFALQPVTCSSYACVSPPIKKVQLLKVPIKPQTILHCINKLVLIKTINFTPMLFSNADEVRFVKAGFEITMSFRARIRIKIFHWKFFRRNSHI